MKCKKNKNLSNKNRHENIQQLPQLLNQMFNLIKILQTDELIDERALKQCNSVDENLNKKKIEVEKMIDAVCERETKVARKLSKVNPMDIRKSMANFNNESTGNLNSDSSTIRSKNSFRESKIIVRDIMDADQYLEERTKELQEIKKISGQIKEITSEMKIKLEDQGQKVDLIDKNVEETKVNVIKAGLEIEEANKISISQTKDYRCLLYSIGFLLAALSFVVLFCFIL